MQSGAKAPGCEATAAAPRNEHRRAVGACADRGTLSPQRVPPAATLRHDQQASHQCAPRGKVPSSLQMIPSITSSGPAPMDTRRLSRQACEIGLSAV
jgi:hypothetical protein